MTNRTYDILKWIVWVVLPALTTFYGAIAPACGFQNTETVLTVLAALTTFLGTVTGASNAAYKAPGPDAGGDE